MPVTNLVAYLSSHPKWLISATRFGEQAGTPYSSCGRTKAPYKEMKTDFERSWKGCLIIKINGLALFAASVHRVEGKNILSVWTPKSLTDLDTVMEVPDPSGENDNRYDCFASCPTLTVINIWSSLLRVKDVVVVTLTIELIHNQYLMWILLHEMITTQYIYSLRKQRTSRARY